MGPLKTRATTMSQCPIPLHFVFDAPHPQRRCGPSQLCVRRHMAPAPNRAGHKPQSATIALASNYGFVLDPHPRSSFAHNTLTLYYYSSPSPPPHMDSPTRAPPHTGSPASGEVNVGTSSMPNPPVVLRTLSDELEAIDVRVVLQCRIMG